MSSVFDIIGNSWDIVKRNFWKFAGMALLIFAIQVIPILFASLPKIPLFFIKLVCSIIAGTFSLGIIKVCILAVDDKPFDVLDGFTTDIFKLLKCFVAGIFYVVGIVLCALPLMFVMVVPFIGVPITVLLIFGFVCTFLFVMYLILDKDMGPLEAFIESASITSGERLNLFGLLILLGLLNIVGAICLGVGLLVTIPIGWVAIAYAYREVAPAPNPHKQAPPPPRRSIIQESDLAPAAPRKPIEVDYE